MKVQLVSILLVVPFLIFPGSPSLAEIDPALLAGMRARSIGPAGMSGRIAAIDAVESNPAIIYIGSATGGLWKSENRGNTWEPIFDDQPVAAIGAVKVFQPIPDIVWVGTGEGNTRNSVSVGNGMYKSIDAGRTWKHLGLEKTERISRILLHPTDPNVAYVAAMGTTWGENRERGVFRTRDGGNTWEKILYVNERTGAADLAIDPANPNRLFAAMWEHRRWPWFFRSGGSSSGLYATSDGGESWERLTPEDGLPEGNLGRIGIAFSRSSPAVVYALVEAEQSALLRSEDGGRTWRTVNTAFDIASRPFYYADIRVDPELPNRVYNLWSLLSVSDDGGKSFEILTPYADVHPDHHALWIDPNHPDFMIDGNDGGVAMSEDRGKTWRFVANLPLAQYYHIDVDMETPFNVYGGMQDNGSWRGPSAVWENGGIRNQHWMEVGFGDGFDTRPDRSHPTQGYSMSQRGFLKRFDLVTGERKDIRPPMPEGTELRFNWNAALAIDPFEAETIYYGSQFVHKSTDRGESWSVLSQDLTTNNPEWQKQAESGGLTPDVTGAENFTSILAIAPSPVQPGVIWVGTDDGRIHLTRDGGENWKSVEDQLRGVPPNTWVPHIEPSKFDPGSAFVVLDDHRRANWTPYVYRTDNFGKTWKSLVTDSIRGYALSIAQDPVDPDLLFLGTEFGLYLTLDAGRSWIPWRHGIPAVGVRDLVVHPIDHALVIGTHGRSAFILDDISPLRSLSKKVLKESIHLFDIPPARQYRVKRTGASRFPGHGEFRGENRPYGALITYSLNLKGLPSHKEMKERQEKRKDSEPGRKIQTNIPKPADQEKKGPQVEIQIQDREGIPVRTIQVPAHLGINRAVWDLRGDPFREPENARAWWRGEPKGPEMPAGFYRIRVTYGEQEATGAFQVLPDPRTPIPDQDRQKKYKAILQAGEMKGRMTEAIERIAETVSDLNTILERIQKNKSDEELGEAVESMKDRFLEMEKRFWAPPDTKGYIRRDDVLAKIDYIQGSLETTWEAPTAAQENYLRQAEEFLDRVLVDFNRLYREDLDRIRSRVRNLDIELLLGREPLTGSPARPGLVSPMGGHTNEIQNWRDERLERLQSETGWLTLVGLFWLREGENRFGTDPANSIVLPEGTAPPFAGSFFFKSGKVRLVAPETSRITLDEQVITKRILRADDSGEPDVLRLNDLYLYLIRRGNRTGVRVKDPNNPIRTGFQGLNYFPIEPRFRIRTKLIPFDPPREIQVPNVLGTVESMEAPGQVQFPLMGRTIRLTPVIEYPEKPRLLFFIFSDPTNRKETYGAGRFLYADLEEDGSVILDFNKAYTPPCAFTPFATCPLPPAVNRLQVRIEAGEKFSGHN
ncbi:MAG: DUF1684 domain-containing protein [Acidobacteria bacterium]|nr:DUF1684 domain-containing protein [Acidobacteriota bacterium]